MISLCLKRRKQWKITKPRFRYWEWKQRIAYENGYFAAGLAVKAGGRLYYSGTDRLYKVVSDHTTQSDWTPDIVPALYTVIDVAHAGTQDDPISAERGMEYVYGLYYTDSEDGKLYLCQRTGEAAGGTVVLQYLPHELVGHYFVAVS